MRHATYEIHLRGVLPSGLALALPGATYREIGGETVLQTSSIDQEDLYDLVSRLRDLGIELLELRKVEAAAPHASEQP